MPPSETEREPTAAGPEVTVVIPAYNALRFVDRAISSALAQTGVRLDRVVVVDDASTDGTLAHLEARAAAEPRLTVLAQPANLGPGAARNRGLDAVRTPWVAVLDADDAMAPDRLSRLIAVAEEGGFDAVGDLWTNWDPRTGAPADEQLPASGAVQALELIDMLQLDPETGAHLSSIKPVFRTALRADGRLAYPDLRHGQDVSLYREMMLGGVRFGLLRDPLYLFTPRMIDGRLVGTSVTRIDYAALARDTRAFGERLKDTPHWSEDLERQIDIVVDRLERKDRRWGWTMLRAGEWRQVGRWVRRDPRKAVSLGRIAVAKAAGHRGLPD